MIITLIAFSLLLASCAEAPVHDNILSLNAGGWSKHSRDRKSGKKWNETHNNIGLEYQRVLTDEGNTKWMRAFAEGDYYKDSYDNHNGFMAGGIKLCPTNGICVPVGLSAFANYDNKVITPYSGIDFNFKGGLTIRTKYVPAVSNKVGFLFIGGRIKAYEW